MDTSYHRNQLQMSGWFLGAALKGITHEDSLRPTATGQTINWLVGHLADARSGALALLTDERAAQKAPFSPSGNPDETVGSLMGVLVFHETYHVGQVGMMRRLAGLDRVR